MIRADRPRPSSWRPRTAAALLAGLVAAVLSGAAVAAAGLGADPKPQPKPYWSLKRFGQLSPAARLRLIEKLADSAAEYHKVTRGEVARLLIERGAIEAADCTEMVCRAKAPGKGSSVAATIKWVIDDGVAVKKGDKLLELDAAALRERLRERASRFEEARIARDQAVAQHKLARKGGKVEVRLAEVQVALTELGLKKYRGTDPDEKQRLQLLVERDKLLLERARIQAQVKDAGAEKEVRAHTAVLDAETERKRDLEAELKHFVLTAPQDGVVVYYVPEQVRRADGAQQSLVAQGEPVRAGQKLLVVCGLTRMKLIARVHEALVGHVRRGQQATVLVDAFPGKLLDGEVERVSPLASQQDWFASDVKVFPVEITLTGKLPALKPGMSAEVRIRAGLRKNVLRVPIQALVGTGKQQTCFVKTKEGIHEQQVTVGLVGDQVAEVTAGLAEGDVVLRDPRGLVGRLPKGS